MSSPFDLHQDDAYFRWRDAKRAMHPTRPEDLVVDVRDPRHLSAAEHDALLRRCAVANMAIYRSPLTAEDKDIAGALARQLGLRPLDGNWLADDDGISSLTVAAKADTRSGFIPYTDRPIQWHTDGYYHPPSRQIRSMILHCVRNARSGGENALMDPEMAYIAVREADPAWAYALMAADAMTIPERQDEDGVARAAQSGPVFSVAPDGALHMRYTARTRSIVWKDDPVTRAAAAFLAQLPAQEGAHVFRLTLQPGMGLVCNNVLHDRSGFVDDPARPRLLYRARYLQRIAGVPLPRRIRALATT
jgi:alpha-ketoglutarate-dependent taurine dioxygenase